MEKKEFEQETFDMDYRAERKEYNERKKQFEDNLQKAFSYIRTFCSATMKL